MWKSKNVGALHGLQMSLFVELFVQGHMYTKINERTPRLCLFKTVELPLLSGVDSLTTKTNVLRSIMTLL